jgi:hypothetical protein
MPRSSTTDSRRSSEAPSRDARRCSSGLATVRATKLREAGVIEEAPAALSTAESAGGGLVPPLSQSRRAPVRVRLAQSGPPRVIAGVHARPSDAERPETLLQHLHYHPDVLVSAIAPFALDKQTGAAWFTGIGEALVFGGLGYRSMREIRGRRGNHAGGRNAAGRATRNVIASGVEEQGLLLGPRNSKRHESLTLRGSA